MNMHDRFPRLTKLAAIGALAGATATTAACGNNSASAGSTSSATSPARCYDVTLVSGSVEGAILGSLESDAGITSPSKDGYYGVHAAGVTINDELLTQHHRYSSVMSGDKFSYCIGGDKQIVPNPNEPPVANDN